MGEFVSEDGLEFGVVEDLSEACGYADGAVAWASACGEGVWCLCGGEVDSGHGKRGFFGELCDGVPEVGVVGFGDGFCSYGCEGDFVAEEEGGEVHDGADDEGGD